MSVYEVSLTFRADEPFHPFPAPPGWSVTFTGPSQGVLSIRVVSSTGYGVSLSTYSAAGALLQKQGLVGYAILEHTMEEVIDETLDKDPTDEEAESPGETGDPYSPPVETDAGRTGQEHAQLASS